MPLRKTIFAKIVVIIVLLLIPILALYAYSNYTSIELVKHELRSSGEKQLVFFLKQMDAQIDQLASFPVVLSRDPHVRKFIHIDDQDQVAFYEERSLIQDKLALQSVSSPWTNDLTLMLPGKERMVSSNIFMAYDRGFARNHIFQNWRYEKFGDGKDAEYGFVRQVVEPAAATRLEKVAVMIQIRFAQDNVENMLDNFKSGGNGDPFLFAPDNPAIVNHTGNRMLIDTISKELTESSTFNLDKASHNGPGEAGHMVLRMNEQDYLVNYVPSKTLGWYLVDYVPMQRILSPLTSSRQMFIYAISLLLMLSVIAAYLLYRNVQIPILDLIRGVQSLKRGDLATRIHSRSDNEFNFLFLRFNEMAEKMQMLIERVYQEKLRYREATLKQLQSQINPHFLYNCLFYIINMVKMDNKEAVVAMAQNLGEYYRYATRADDRYVTIQEELKLVETYITIQNLRTNRIMADIQVPDSMLPMRIPRLLLQPLVENALIHGIEKKAQKGILKISGSQGENECHIYIEDNGVGMTQEGLDELNQQLLRTMTKEIGYGTWNVHQRLNIEFGEGSGLRFEVSELGGLKVIVKWANRNDQEKGDLIDAPASNH